MATSTGSNDQDERLTRVKNDIDTLTKTMISESVVLSYLDTLATDIDGFIRFLRIAAQSAFQPTQDRPWESGDCHGYIEASEGRMELRCKGACPGDPRGKDCDRREIRDDPNKKTTYFCACADDEPKKCHLVLIHHHDTGVYEPKCLPPDKEGCEGDKKCTLKKKFDKFFRTWYYWCVCDTE